jgi:two-component system, probable response regulator PhcQ
MKPVVLLVDDDEMLLAGLRRALYQEPYALITASDAQTALDQLAAQKVDVIVSDQQMPGLSGTEFLAEAAKRFPATMRVMLTGHADLSTAVEAINRGQIYRFLTKPCSDVELGVTIRQALQQRELLAQSKRLLETVKKQSACLTELEKDNPGISTVRRDEVGAIVIDETADIGALLDEIKSSLK